VSGGSYGTDRKGISAMNQTVAAVVLVGLLAGCASTGGAGLGISKNAFSGSTRPVSAAIVDAMAGGLIARTPGLSLDRGERRRALEAEYRALEYTSAGEPVAWGRASGRRGEVVAGSPYRVGSQDCRQYTHTVITGANPLITRGTACRNQDGSWTVLA
jgi:surface antigen